VDSARGFLDAGFRSLIAVNEVEQMTEPLANLLLDEAARHGRERPDEALLAPFRWEVAGSDLATFYRELARP